MRPATVLQITLPMLARRANNPASRP
jgi:hypothetical protein